MEKEKATGGEDVEITNTPGRDHGFLLSKGRAYQLVPAMSTEDKKGKKV